MKEKKRGEEIDHRGETLLRPRTLRLGFKKFDGDSVLVLFCFCFFNTSSNIHINKYNLKTYTMVMFRFKFCRKDHFCDKVAGWLAIVVSYPHSFIHTGCTCVCIVIHS